VDALYKDQTAWARRSILCTAGMGKFSSDRTVAEYARDIWNVKVHAHPLCERVCARLRVCACWSLFVCMRA
jgi:hypothetical protein